MEVAIVIPALNPPENFFRYITDLDAAGNFSIVIVNDGSADSYEHIFNDLEKKENVTVLTHIVNRGKGAALKTAFQYIRTHADSNLQYIITADCDGQHAVDDIVKIIACAKSKDDTSIIFGSRDFTMENIPAKSKFGNVLTSKLLSLFLHIHIKDTQTGLRCIPFPLLEQMIYIKGTRFEYEMNMILYCCEQDISIFEFPIKTIYIKNNAETHFNPLTDSIKIYFQIFKRFIKFAAISLGSFLIDIVLFTFMQTNVFAGTDGLSIFISTLVARIVSSLCNFFLNKCFVFHGKEAGHKSLMKYYLLAGIQLSLSWFFVWIVYKVLSGNTSIIKIFIDTFLFILSYFVQKRFVFK